MKTKYILHGGFAQHINSGNDKFFNEILRDTGDKVKILLVEFAHSLERYEVNFNFDKSQFLRVKGGKNLSFTLANEKFFKEQIKDNDIIYICGGTTVCLMGS